jgi:4-carboxymuconolactone decarboxylase
MAFAAAPRRRREHQDRIMAEHPGDGVETIPPKRTELPADVHPDSRTRLPLVRRENLDEAGQKAYDAVTDPNSRLRAELIGPAGVWLNVPELSPHIREINWYLRHRVSIAPRLVELAILCTVREGDGENEWASHEPAGLRAGLSQETIDIVKWRKPVEGLAQDEAVIIKLARQLLGEKHLPSGTYAEALRIFGQKELVHLILLMANYAQTSIILHAFDSQMRSELTPLLPVAQRR